MTPPINQYNQSSKHQNRFCILINHTMSAAGIRKTVKRKLRDALMTLSLTTLTAVSGCFCFCCFSLSKTRKSPVVSERPLLLGHAPTSIAPRALYVSRIEIRLLRDTRRVLEYLSKKQGRSQPCVMRACEKMKR
jgi:hypothetical protein